MSDTPQSPGATEAAAVQDLPEERPPAVADTDAAPEEVTPPARTRKRPKPGERRVQILVGSGLGGPRALRNVGHGVGVLVGFECRRILA